MGKGMVYLVGAGPGDPGLITVRGTACLNRADVIIYDRLINRKLLAHARPGCELIGREGETQSEINRLMAERAREGRTVVRLKGGDPFLFGRGGEEAEFLAGAGIPFEVVPGVTSALAAPTYAGIPLTHRQLSSAVGIVTGHEAPDKVGSAVNWEAVSRAVDTLVILMGMGNLSAIVKRLLRAGKSEDTPVAVVCRGTLPGQETLVSSLGRVAREAEARGLQPPAVIVVGEVVRLWVDIGWFESKPLFGQRILVAGEAARLAALASLLEEEGAQVWEVPVIRIAPNRDTASLDRAIRKLGGYDWLVFTSSNGVSHFWARLRALDCDTRVLGGVRVAAIGPATAAALAERGLTANLIPGRYCTEGLVEAFATLDLSGKNVLLARSDQANPLLPQRLSAIGALVEEVLLYHTAPGSVAPERQAEVEEMLHRGGVDLVAFTSSSTVRCFTALFAEPDLQKALQAVPIACLGPETARTARRLGLSVEVVAERYTLRGLVQAIVSHSGGGR